MLSHTHFCLVLLAALSCALASSDKFGQNPQHEFGALYSNAKPIIPFWKLSGNAVATDDFVRITSDRQSQMGALWNSVPNRFNSWEVIMSVRIHGVGHLGADGMGFWYTQKPAMPEGDFFGFRESFRGLGVVVDTYDNDGTGNHPQLILMYNDGTKSKNVASAAAHDPTHLRQVEQSMQLGSCQIKMRNVEKQTYIKVTYWQNSVTVSYDLGSTGTWTDCVSATSQIVPTGYYFGFTAETGQLADNHDLHGIAIRNLDSNAMSIDSMTQYSGQARQESMQETLSKLNLAMKTLPTGGSSSSGGLSAKDLANIQGTLARVEQRLGTLESRLSGSQQTTQKLDQILNQIRHVESIPDGLGGIFSSLQGLFRALWYALGFVVFVVVVYCGYLLYRVLASKKTRSNKQLY
mmetsp:Transcript_19779/g.22005  ORF Transcript_19779/g.22005 Transcript_19779/m.22005 type:complete len:406 (-) Transcript_19779:69-1286(-)